METNPKSGVAAVILAAGQSSRLGRPKQLIQISGQTLVCRAVAAAEQAGCGPIAVVTGANADALRSEIEHANVVVVENSQWERGLGASIKAGLRALTADLSVNTIVLLLCDQVFVDATVVRQLISLKNETKMPVVASVYANTYGVPALFDQSCFAELLALPDDSGAKPVILRDLNRVAEFPFPEGEFDLDSTVDLARFGKA